MPPRALQEHMSRARITTLADMTGIEFYNFVRSKCILELFYLPGYHFNLYAGDIYSGLPIDLIPRTETPLSEISTWWGASIVDIMNQQGITYEYMPPSLKQLRQKQVFIWLAPVKAQGFYEKPYANVFLDSMPTGQDIFNALDTLGLPGYVNKFAVFKLIQTLGEKLNSTKELEVSRKDVLDEPVMLGGDRVLVVMLGSDLKKGMQAGRLVRPEIPLELAEKIAEYMEGGKRRPKYKR